AKSVGIHGHLPLREGDGVAEQREFVLTRVRTTQAALGHLLGREDPRWPPSAHIVPVPNGPEMVLRTQCGGTVLRGETVDLLLSLRMNTDHRGRPTVRTDDQITDLQLADG